MKMIFFCNSTRRIERNDYKIRHEWDTLWSETLDTHLHLGWTYYKYTTECCQHRVGIPEFTCWMSTVFYSEISREISYRWGVWPLKYFCIIFVCSTETLLLPVPSLYERTHKSPLGGSDDRGVVQDRHTRRDTVESKTFLFWPTWGRGSPLLLTSYHCLKVDDKLLDKSLKVTLDKRPEHR